MSRENRVEAILFCSGETCTRDGSYPLAVDLRNRLKELDSDVEVGAYPCFGECGLGPNVAFCPNGPLYRGVSRENLIAVEEFITKGTPIIGLDTANKGYWDYFSQFVSRVKIKGKLNPLFRFR